MKIKKLKDFTPVTFEGVTKTLKRPPSMKKEDCGDLPVYNDETVTVSCWKLPFLQRIYFLFTGKVFLTVLYGKSSPPVMLNYKNPIDLSSLPDKDDEEDKPSKQ